MPKILKVKFPKDCNGCELCVMEVQRQLKKVGLEGSMIRILRDKGAFSVDIDPHVLDLDLGSIEKICPKANFSVEEVEEDNVYLR